MRSLLRGRPQSTYLARRSEGPASPGGPGTLSPTAPTRGSALCPQPLHLSPSAPPAPHNELSPAPLTTPARASPALHQALSPARPEPPDPPRSPRSRRRGSAGPGPAASRLAAASFLRAARRGFGFQPTSSARRTRTPDPETRQRPARRVFPPSASRRLFVSPGTPGPCAPIPTPAWLPHSPSSLHPLPDVSAPRPGQEAPLNPPARPGPVSRSGARLLAEPAEPQRGEQGMGYQPVPS